MGKNDPDPRSASARAKAEARAERERRLAEALRRNLKRRKEQLRGRAAEIQSGEDEPGRRR